VIGCGPGQAGDSPALNMLLAELRVATGSPGRPRTTPSALLGDKAYSSRGHREQLRRLGIKVVIPEPADQADQVRRPALPQPQRRRTMLQHPQELARHRHPLRQESAGLPRRCSPGSHPHVAVMTWRHALGGGTRQGARRGVPAGRRTTKGQSGRPGA
jgi:hypothetical protein